ncbi:MAG TPA: pyridoxamine 5'-phosphate oxidase family protein [Acidimicrobiales bacterium]|nr:pyridoxamine 5'-phosphate oxidase family protein [Acidimicrobiales bacterium]
MRNIDLTGGAEMVTEGDCWSLLHTVEYGRLVVDADGRPDIFPINFDVVGSTIVFQTNMGHKLLAALRGPVAFEADHVDRESGVAWSVVVHGRAENVTDQWPGIETRDPYLGPKQYTVRIDPESISGRRLRVPARQGLTS